MIALQFINKQDDPLLSAIYRQQVSHHYMDYNVRHTNEYLELPRWIAEVSHQTHLEGVVCIQKPYSCTGFEFVTSVMSSNRKLILDMICMSPNSLFNIGGYGNLDDFKKYDNVTVLKSPTQLGDKEPGVDWSVFNGQHTLPRLQLSTGCRNKCKFCTVPHVIKEVSHNTIVNEVDSICDNLNFTHIYIDDKTFGQCKNFQMLNWLYDYIRERNDNFIGFVIQTTLGQFIEHTFLYKDLHVKYVELGIETHNDSILSLYGKTNREVHNEGAIAFAFATSVNVIPNIMVGFPEETKETYQRTLDFLYKNKHALSFINIFPYTKYSSKVDNDESTLIRSFHNDQQTADMIWMINQLVGLNNELLRRT